MAVNRTDTLHSVICAKNVAGEAKPLILQRHSLCHSVSMTQTIADLVALTVASVLHPCRESPTPSQRRETSHSYALPGSL
jgi:hypothetical protein